MSLKDTIVQKQGDCFSCHCGCHQSLVMRHGEHWEECCEQPHIPKSTIERRILLAEYQMAEDAAKYPTFSVWLVEQLLRLRREVGA